MLYQSFREAQWDDDFSPEDAFREAEQNLNILVRLYFMRHSFEATDIYLVSPLSRLGFLCLKALSENPALHELEYIRSTLALVLNGLSSQSQNANITRALLKVVKSSTPKAEIQAIQHKENVSSNESEVNEDHMEGYIQSAWIPSVVSISDDLKSKQLSKLVAQAFIL